MTPPAHRVMAFVIVSLPLAFDCARSATVWEGDVSSDWADAMNWSDGLPDNGEAVAIKDSTANSSLVLDVPHHIGSLSFGDGVGADRVAAFEIQTRGQLLTHSGGLVANGNFSAVGLTLRGRHLLEGDQTWVIGGSPGSATSDSGVVFRPREDSLLAGSVQLEGDISRSGSGQLMFLGVSLGGPGDLILPGEGSLKFNAGAGLPVSASAGGSIVLNGGRLLTSQNSGTFENFDRRIVMNALPGGGDGSVWEHGQGLSGVAGIGSPVVWNGDPGTFHEIHIGLGANLRLSGEWSGGAGVEVTSGSSLTLSGASPDFQGQLSFDEGPILNGTGYASLNIAGDFGGSILSLGGLIDLDAPVSGDIEVLDGVLRVNQPVSGDLIVRGPGMVKFGADLEGGLTLDATTAWLDPLAAQPVQPASFTLATVAVTHVVLSKLPPGAGDYPLMSFPATSLDLSKLELAGLSLNYRGPTAKFLINDLGAFDELRVAVAPAAITWTGVANDDWDANSTSNWSGTGNKFFHLDTVTFTDAGAGTVILKNTLYPGLVNLANTSGNNYTFSGSGSLSGCASIRKTGTGTVTLGGANDFTGPISVEAGLLKLGSAGAFGHSSGITISSGAQVDLGGQKPGLDPARAYHYRIAGTGLPGQSAASQGAIVNTNNVSGNELQGAAGIHSLELTGDALISSSMGGRFDIGYTNARGAGTLKGNGHTLTVKAKNKPASGPQNNYGMPFRADGSNSPVNIVAAAGVIWAEGSPNAFGGATGTLRVKSGAKAGSFGRLTLANAVFLEGGSTLHNQGNGTGTWTGTITLEGNATIEANGRRVVVSGPIIQNSATNRTLAKTGDNTLVISGNCTYGGTTTVADGTLLVNGSLGTGSVSVPADSTLGGNGTVGGNITISNNGILSPGESVGSLRGNGLATLAAGAQYVWEIGDWNGSVPGTGWDFFGAASVDLDATASNKLDILVTGIPANYSAVPRTFAILSSDVAITGFNAAAITAPSPSVGSASSWTFRLSPDSRTILMDYLGGAQDPYSTWAGTIYQLAGNDARADADPDRDGILNIDEFAFDGNPKSGIQSRKIVSKVVSLGGQQVLTLTLPVRTGAVFTGTTALVATRDGVSYRIEGSDQLATWNLDLDEITGSSATTIRAGLGLPALSGSDWEYRTFRSPGGVAGDPRDFLRASSTPVP